MKRPGRQRARTWVVRWRAARILASGDATADCLGWLEARTWTAGEIAQLTAQLRQLPPPGEETP